MSPKRIDGQHLCASGLHSKCLRQELVECCHGSTYAEMKNIILESISNFPVLPGRTNKGEKNALLSLLHSSLVTGS